MYFNRTHFLLLMLVSITCFSQDDGSNDVRDVTKATFLDPGISYEKRIGRLQTLSLQALLSSAIYIGYSDALGNTSSINFYPAVASQYRYYYNAGKREAKGRRTEMNSLNYMGALAEVSFYKPTIPVDGEDEIRTLQTLGIVWGFQRNYPKRFSLDLNLGIGYAHTKETIVDDAGHYASRSVGKITNIGQIAFGFWLNRRN